MFTSMLLFGSCCWFNKEACKDCYEDANLWFPDIVYNIEITNTTVPTVVNGQYFPLGTTVFVGNGGSFNEFFSVVKYNSYLNENVTYFWNRDTPANFTSLNEGDVITFYKTVINRRQDNSISCIFAEVEEVTSILDVRVRADENGEITGTRQVEKTIFNIPSGKYGTFNFEFDYFSCGNYEFNIQIDPEGQLSETSTIDNNYSEILQNFGNCN